jgi:hypothetical protein
MIVATVIRKMGGSPQRQDHAEGPEVEHLLIARNMMSSA